MEYREIWGVSAERISEYFSAQPCALEDGPLRFRLGETSVILTRLPDNTVTGFAMPRTEVLISGHRESTEAVYRGFFMRFLSAGG